ncbi:MAG: 6-phosphofructokinase [Flavobacteriaceae bacterium]|nr:6-phosphofructokinase [Bacteroidia bacterium]NNL16466.1 6-phosphofructokinase [Flavobacteriaceae bacterium]
MKKFIKKVAVMTSGGDSPGMNAAIRSVIRAAAFYNLDSVGIYRGYQGLIEGDIEHMNARSAHHLVQKGGTALKTARSKEFMTVEGRKKAYDNLVKYDIDAMVVIGGDGSFTGAMVFSNEFDFPIIGIPGTIDNDIFGTDFTVGYDTALNTAIEVIDKIRDTASSHNRLFFVEVMGRDAGHIALNAGIGAGAEEILIPEEDMGIDRLLITLEKSRRSGKTSSLVIVAEGDKTGDNVFHLAKYVEDNLPEYDVRVSVLGHMQRGGAPSCFDRVLASRMGVHAVELLIDGKSNVMVGLQNGKMTTTPLENAIKENNPIDKEILRVSDIMSV